MNEPNKRKPCDHCGTAERAEGVRFCSVCIKVKRKEARQQACEMTPIDYKPRYSTMRGEKCRDVRKSGPSYDVYD